MRVRFDFGRNIIPTHVILSTIQFIRQHFEVETGTADLYIRLFNKEGDQIVLTEDDREIALVVSPEEELAVSRTKGEVLEKFTFLDNNENPSFYAHVILSTNGSLTYYKPKKIKKKKRSEREDGS